MGSKKIKTYSGTSTTPSVPTSVGNVLVREIADDAFSNTVESVTVDAYSGEITGAPWGAQNVIWNKSPKCTLTYNGNGGSTGGNIATVLTWDGNTTGKTKFSDYYKISSTVPDSMNNFVGGTLKAVVSGIEHIYPPITQANINQDETYNTIYYIQEGAVLVVMADTVTAEFGTIEKGIWFLQEVSTIYLSYISYNSNITAIIWDGDITGKECVAGAFYKMTTTVPSSSDGFIGGTFSYVSDGTNYSKTIVVGNIQNINDDCIVIDEGTITVAFQDTTIYETPISKGIWFTKSNDDYATSVTYSTGITEKVYTVNKGIATKVVDNMFTTVPTGKQFDKWAIGSTEGTQIAAGTNYAFADSTDLYAIWKDAT